MVPEGIEALDTAVISAELDEALLAEIATKVDSQMPDASPEAKEEKVRSLLSLFHNFFRTSVVNALL